MAVAIAILLLGSCAKDEPTGHDHEDAAGLVIFADGIEATGHIPLTSGGTNRIVFKLLDADNHVITDTDHFQLTLTWNPTDLATATPVAGTTTEFDVSTTKPFDTAGELALSVYHPHSLETRTFGPIHILVH